MSEKKYFKIKTTFADYYVVVEKFNPEMDHIFIGSKKNAWLYQYILMEQIQI